MLEINAGAVAGDNTGKGGHDHVPWKSRRLYYPQLDGLRFFAYALVLVHHFYSPGSYFEGAPIARSILEKVHTFGWIGVDLFLVLSSFLIFSLLLAERRRTGTVSIKAFYIRRAMRIWPLYFPYLIVSMVILPFVWSPFPQQASYYVTLKQHLLPFLSFLGNLSYASFYSSLSPLFAHLWTVCLEEQFYIFPPILLFFFALRPGRGVLIGCAALLVFTIACRCYVLANHIPYPMVWVNPLCRMDPFIIGAIGALFVEQRPAWLRQRWTGYLLSMAAVLLFWLVAAFPNINKSFHVAWQLLVVSLGAGCLVLATFAWSGLARTLSRGPLPFLGKITFGLYVYHEVALGLLKTMNTSKFLGTTYQAYCFDLMIILLINIAIAAASYLIYEARILKLKARFEIVKSRPV